jgi:hypothetical protein
VTGLLTAVNTLEPAYTKYASSRVVRPAPLAPPPLRCCERHRAVTRMGHQDPSGDDYEMTVLEIDSVNHRSVIKDLFVVEVRPAPTLPQRGPCLTPLMRCATPRARAHTHIHTPPPPPTHQRLQEEVYWLVRKEFLRGHSGTRDAVAPVNRIKSFFSDISSKLWDVVAKAVPATSAPAQPAHADEATADAVPPVTDAATAPEVAAPLAAHDTAAAATGAAGHQSG